LCRLFWFCLIKLVLVILSIRRAIKDHFKYGHGSGCRSGQDMPVRCAILSIGAYLFLVQFVELDLRVHTTLAQLNETAHTHISDKCTK